MDHRNGFLTAAVAATLLAAAPVVAVDGVIEINQARMAAGGITPGDPAGFPILITEPGSYRLTSDLVVPGAGLDGIYISPGVHGVSIDLNGFEIRGPVSCSGTPPAEPVVCAPAGSGVGIWAWNSNGTMVSNGSVRGMGGNGISCGHGCSVVRVYVEHCGAHGIGTQGGVSITDSRASRNGSLGISTGSGLNLGIIKNNVVVHNGSIGIGAGANNLVEGNSVSSNASTGIFSNGGSVVGNVSTSNGGDGVRLNTGLVKDNTLVGNLGFGLTIALSNAVGYVGNVIRNNTAGTITGTGVELGANLCGSNTTCP